MKKVYASTVLGVARGEIGYREKASNSQLDDKTANAGSGNWTKYGRDLAKAGFFNGNKNGYPWCATGATWSFYKAAGEDKEKAEQVMCFGGPYGAGVDWRKRYYKAAGRCDRIPRIGDEVFFGPDGGEHVGLVETIDGDRIGTIEFNRNNRVQRCLYKLSDPYIDSFGHPLYDEEPDEQEHDRRYQTLEEIPAYARETISDLMESGRLIGRTEDGENLDLSDDMVRILEIVFGAG